MGDISHYLRKFFAVLGTFVAHHPKKCVLLPVIVTIFLGYGVTYYKYIDDLHYLYTITGSENKKSQEFVSSYFPENPSYYDPSRTLSIGRFIRIIVTDKEESTVLTTEIWEELIQLDGIISSVEVDNMNQSSLCVTWKEECLSLNYFLEMKESISDFVNGSLKLSYPVMFDFRTLKAFILPTFLGGVNLNYDKHSVITAKAITLNYFFKIQNEEDDKRGEKWELQVIKRLDELDSKWKHIKIYRFSLATFANEGLATLIAAMPAFVVSGTIAIFFAVITSMQSDCVRSKPMLGFFGLVSVLLATVAAFGVLIFFGVPMTLMEVTVPFILLGIGMDDTFVLLAAWRKTNCRDPVDKRLSECYSDAAVSITITSLTDMLSFFVGILTPIPAVQLFSICAGTGVLFIYFWHLFFFGGLLAISGYNEEKNKHSVFWWLQAIPKSKSKNVSGWKRMILIGGYDKCDPMNPANDSENALMAFFRDDFSTAICSKCGQVVVITTYITYVIISLWGLSHLQEGSDIDQLVRFGSDTAQYMEKQKQFFSIYGYRIQIVIGTPLGLDYSTNETQSRINEMLLDIYGLEHLTIEYNENWLRDYTRYLSVYHEDLYKLNATREKEFNRIFLEDYSHDGMRTHLDVKFNEDNSTIIASRYIVQSKDVGKPNSMRDVVNNLRNTLKKYKDLNATAFMPWLDFVDQSIIIRKLATKLIIIAAVVVMAVTVLFIPNILTSIAACFSIASIYLGVIGLMSFLDVPLDIISLTSIVTCLGFSVDFSAHISYAYISSKASNSKDRVREAMYFLGLPITQGAVTTVIEVLGLLYIPSYSFRVCFKILFLVMIFATFHGLFVLPVLFTILKPENLQNFFKRKTYELKTGKTLKF